MPYLDELFVRRTSEWLDEADGRLLDHPSTPVGLTLVHQEVTAKGLILLQYDAAGDAPVAQYEGVTAFV